LLAWRVVEPDLFERHDLGLAAILVGEGETIGLPAQLEPLEGRHAEQDPDLALRIVPFDDVLPIHRQGGRERLLAGAPEWEDSPPCEER
jgi:hypothetical protein